MTRPQGFQRFIYSQGFHSLLLVTNATDARVRVSTTADPVQHLAYLRKSLPVVPQVHRQWWLAGQPVARRIERAFRDRFKARASSGWFDVSAADAEVFVDATIGEIGTWGAREADVIALMHCVERQQHVR